MPLFWEPHLHQCDSGYSRVLGEGGSNDMQALKQSRGILEGGKGGKESTL